MATLNVKDALSYLDQVKVQFSEHPDVYNRFLDIMKDFKSQSIDTPGVIERVSTLFRGHPSLIQGFNTFLPPGYRIECSLDPSESNMITVTTPTGTTTQSSGGVGIAGAINRMSGAGGTGGSAGPSGAQRRGPIGRPLSPPPNAGVAPSTPGATAGAGVLSHGGDMGGADAKRAPVEFNHAINYVNKIKQRFSGDPDTYKQFLEILQTYQKEQRPIHDVYAQVTTLFNNDKNLLDEFKQFLPDTSAGGGGAPAPGLFGMLGQVSAGLGQPGVVATAPADSIKRAGAGASGASRKKRAAEAAAGPGAKAGGVPGVPGAAAAASSKKKSKHHHAAGPGHLPHKTERSPPPMGSPQYAHMPPPMPQGQGQPPMMMPYGMMDPAMMDQHVGGMGVPGGGMMGGAGGAGGLQQAPNGMPVGGPRAAPLATLDEIAFFDKVKKHIDDRATYLEFLKLLNLYTQDIIDVRTLVDRAALFIGGHRELFNTFKALCGYDMSKHGWLENEDPIIENVPALQRDKVDLGSCKQYGASYRKLPKSEVNLACSGRDPMCWEVLNDVWVSHPTWASEGEGFNPHKKNVFEDALYRSEEERHEYDYHIEANLRTIALLEPIAARISTMDAEERQTFRLKPGLGGQSKSIYQRVVKKVYGREHGIEVIAALHDNPCVAVPVVLTRLKQKDEEWKRAQREWNKVWREVDARNYYKSLDHQGVNFKASDKKAITTKAFVAEIETRRTQQYQRRLAVDPSLPRARAAHQLVYSFDDTNVLADVLKLAFSFLDRSNYSRAECERIEAFLRSFVPQLLDLERADFEELLNGGVTEVGAANDEDDEDEDDDDARSETATADDDAASDAGSSTRQRKGRSDADLRRKLLRTQAETAASNGAAVGNGDVEMTAADAADSGSASSAGAVAAAAAADAVKTWIQVDADANFSTGGGAAAAAGGPAASSKSTAPLKKRCNFFCSTLHYVFIRLLQLLYARLHKMKTLGAKMASEWPGKTKFNPIALELGLQDPSSGPARIVGQAAASAAANSGSGESSTPAEDSGLTIHPSRYYDTLLDLVEKLFDGDIDQNQFEEAARFMYGIEAYVTFTVDKVVGALVKAVQTITSDSKCQELQSILDKDRAASRASPSAAAVDYKAHISRRMAAEAVVGREENLFRIEFQPATSTMLIQMLGKDDLTLGDEGSDAQQRWQYYIASYALWTPTEGLPAPAQAPFLKRSLADSSRDRDVAGVSYTTHNGLEIKVCISTYRLFFVQDTEDSFARHVPKDVAEKQRRVRASLDKKRKSRFSAWLEANNPAAPPAETSAEGAEDAAEAAVSAAGPSGEGESAEAAGEVNKGEGEAAAAKASADDKMDADNEGAEKPEGAAKEGENDASVKTDGA